MGEKVLFFHQLDQTDLDKVGGKGANLGDPSLMKVHFRLHLHAFFDFLHTRR